jgi:ribonucleoside-diphosphate reductase alpha chain
MLNFNKLEIPDNNLVDWSSFLDDKTLQKWNILDDDETLKDAFARVAKSIAVFEDNYVGGNSIDFEHVIIEQLQAKKIIPSTPILMNAGRVENTPLSACVIPPIELREDWGKIKTKVDELHCQGMGTGFNFDETDKPIALIKYLNQVGIDGKKDKRQLRPVGNIGTMSLDNPKIMEFINLKDGAEVKNEDWAFNLSVNLSDTQIDKILNKEEIELKNGNKISSDELLTNIAKAIWLSGDPGLVFMDRVRADNTVPKLGESVGVAPCGEVGLARGESCQFSYINLGKFVKDGEIDYEGLKSTIVFSMHFLDNIVDYNIKNSSNQESILMASNKRKIGLGVCGFNDVLKEMSLEYGSDESIKLAKNLFSFINYQSKIASVDLAKQRGAFKMFSESQLVGDSHMMNKLAEEETETVSKNDWLKLIDDIKANGIRHCSTTALPPTGRSSQIVKASQSIEPSFKNFLHVDSHKQIEMVAAIQKFIDEAISKTINVKNETTVEEIKNILLESMSHGLKGITIYRDGSRSNQPKKI